MATSQSGGMASLGIKGIVKEPPSLPSRIETTSRRT